MPRSNKERTNSGRARAAVARVSRTPSCTHPPCARPLEGTCPARTSCGRTRLPRGGHRCQPVFVGWRELAARTMRELAFHLAPHAHAVEERAVTVEYHADWSLARHLAVLSPVSLFPLEPSKKESCPAVRKQAFGRVAHGLAPVAENETLHVLVDHDGEESQKENHSRRAHIAQGARRHVLFDAGFKTR